MMTKYLATLYGKNFNINSVVLGGVSNSEINKSFVKNYSKLNPKKKIRTHICQKKESVGSKRFNLKIVS